MEGSPLAWRGWGGAKPLFCRPGHVWCGIGMVKEWFWEVWGGTGLETCPTKSEADPRCC